MARGSMAALGVGVSALVFALGALTAAAAGLEGYRALQLERGREATTAAIALPRGADRDGALDKAQTLIAEALVARGDDPRLWDLMGEIRFLQATEAQIAEVSPALLDAAIDASARAEALDPHAPDAGARLAAALAVKPDRARARAALRRSYAATSPATAVVGLRRIAAARDLWPELDDSLQTRVRAEICVLARDGQAEAVGLIAVKREADPSFVLQALNALQDPGCQPLT